MTESMIENLERRVAALERDFAQQFNSPAAPNGWKDWRKAVGNFVPSELSEEIDAAGREIREADRRQGDA